MAGAHPAADLEALQEALAYRFADPALLDLALTHSSTRPPTQPAGPPQRGDSQNRDSQNRDVQNHDVQNRDVQNRDVRSSDSQNSKSQNSKSQTRHGRTRNNQRLEFLGDAVLASVLSEHLYRAHPDWDEGQMSVARTALVRRDSLARIALSLQIDSLLRIRRDVARSGPLQRLPTVLADACEALLGAVLIDGGYPAAQQVILHLFADVLDVAPEKLRDKDAKTRLQEWLMQRGRSVPEYQLLSADGAAHARTFVVECRISKPPAVAQGTGSSRKMAEQAAAEQVLQHIEQANRT